MDQRKPPPAQNRRRDETWVIDPSDVQRHARRMRERDRPGLLRKLALYGGAALAVAALAAAYWKRETLLGITVEAPALTSLFTGRSAPGGPGAPDTGGAAAPTTVEAPAVVGTRAPTSLDAPTENDDAPAAEPARPKPPAAGPAASAEAADPAAAAAAATEPPLEPSVDPAAQAQVPAPAAAPEPPPPPPEPETFEFGLDRVEVSESAASAAVLILRYGDRGRASSVRWWTEDGTAKAGVDYVSIGAVTEKFARGEQNRTIHVPIVGDHNSEGPETFFVVVRTRTGDDAAIPVKRLEVVINDDD